MNEIDKKIVKFIKEKTPTKQDIRKEFGIKQKQLEDVVKKNNRIIFQHNHFAYEDEVKKVNDVLIVNNSDDFRELYISDTHISDKGCNYKLIEKIINEAYSKGARTIYHSGDVTTGKDVYRGQIHDLQDLTFGQQIDRTLNTLPYKRDLEYYIINGNHDLEWLRKDAGNIGHALYKQRKDINFLGDGYGRIIKNGVKIDLVHLKNAGTYSRGYPLQTYLREFLQSGIDDRPHILSGGHLHQLLYMNYYGINCIMPGHFLNPTEFTKRRGLTGMQGGVLVEYKFEKNKINNFNLEFLLE